MRRGKKRMYRVYVDGQKMRAFRILENAVLAAVAAARKFGRAVVIRINDSPYSYAVNAIEFYLDQNGELQTKDWPHFDVRVCRTCPTVARETGGKP